MSSVIRFPKSRPGSTDSVIFTHTKYVPNNQNRPKGDNRPPFVNFNPTSKSSYRDGPPSGKRIILYMPTTIPGMRTQQSWDSTGNTFGSPWRRLLVSTLSTQFFNNDPNGSAGPDIKDLVNQEAYAYGMSKATGTSVNEILTLTGGAIFNPNVEMLYDGLSTRGFQFDFFMAANSSDDTERITDIVNEFKQFSSPSAKDNWLTVPHIWQVAYESGISGKKTYFNKFKPSVITAINVQDNAGLNYHSTFKDGSPIVTAISLSFAEVDIITREDHEEAIEEGYFRGY